MTNWTGKVVGLLLGLLTRNRYLIVIGLIVGHLYDIGAFRAATKPPAPPPPANDPYATLGVSASASDEEIEQAWRRRMSEYHPDRVANSADEIRALAETRAREINTAYETIQQQRRKG
jgi:preprotein translocase subunit Sec63